VAEESQAQLQGHSDTSDGGSCIPKWNVNVSAVRKKRSLWRTHIHATDATSLSNTNGAETTFPTPTVRPIWLNLWMRQVFFMSSGHFCYIKPSWLIRPVSKSKELLSGSEGFYLLFPCQSVHFRGTLRFNTPQESHADLCFLFFLPLPKASTAYPDCFLHLLPFKKGAHTENLHLDFHL